MKYRFGVFVALFITADCVIAPCVADNTWYIDGVEYIGTAVVLNRNLVVNKSGLLCLSGEDNNIYVDSAGDIKFTNYGNVVANFVVKSDSELFVRNTGKIDGVFSLEDGAGLHLIINNDSDSVRVNTDSDYELIIENVENINLNGVLQRAGNVNNIVLKNSDAILNVGDFDFTGPIEILGDVVIRLDNVLEYDSPVLSNLTVNGSLSIDVVTPDSLFFVNQVIDGDSLYLKLVRNTNYTVALQNKTGVFLDNLRAQNPNDKLFDALDSALSVTEINSILAKSVRFNPINLMNVPRLVNRFYMLNTMYQYNVGNLSAELSYLFSDGADVHTVGVNNFIAVTDSFLIDLSINASEFSVSDGINEYSGNLFGAKISSWYNAGAFISRTVAGVGISKTDVGLVLDDDKVFKNPRGTSAYLSSDMGLKIVDGENICLAPFAGFISEFMSVALQKDFSFDGKFGADMSVKVWDADVKYDYGTRLGIITDGVLYGSVFANILLQDDDVGLHFSAGVLYDKTPSYNLSVSAKYLF